MAQSFHALPELFAQLGLSARNQDIDTFILTHGPLPSGVALADAPFWSAAQATFLREALAEDADWAEAVDHLDALLR